MAGSNKIVSLQNPRATDIIQARNCHDFIQQAARLALELRNKQTIPALRYRLSKEAAELP